MVGFSHFQEIIFDSKQQQEHFNTIKNRYFLKQHKKKYLISTAKEELILEQNREKNRSVVPKGMINI